VAQQTLKSLQEEAENEADCTIAQVAKFNLILAFTGWKHSLEIIKLHNSTGRAIDGRTMLTEPVRA
jgi:hypothetical protein